MGLETHNTPLSPEEGKGHGKWSPQGQHLEAMSLKLQIQARPRISEAPPGLVRAPLGTSEAPLGTSKAPSGTCEALPGITSEDLVLVGPRPY